MKLDGAKCAGQHELFESIDASDHKKAAKLCAQCPAINACQEYYEQIRDIAVAQKMSKPSGTWAGKLHWYGEADRRPSVDRDRIAIEDEMFTLDEARVERSRYQRGDRDDRAVIGARVYERKYRRLHKSRRAS
jgi:Transcription factor WhiB